MRFFLSRLFQKLISFYRSFSLLEIYTDGSSKNGVGSWAFVITRRGKSILEKSGRVRKASSNQMEFQAAIEALNSVTEKSRITLFADSRILVDSLTVGEAPKGHETQTEFLMKLNQEHQIHWQWVKAHNGNKFNERCDQLCTLAREEYLK